LCNLNNADFDIVDISVENEPVDILNGGQRCSFNISLNTSKIHSQFAPKLLIINVL